MNPLDNHHYQTPRRIPRFISTRTYTGVTKQED
jgi:hypothetical protein